MPGPFGLNYNQGFGGSGPFISGQGWTQPQVQHATNEYGAGVRQESQFGRNLAQQASQFGQTMGLQHEQLAQQGALAREGFQSSQAIARMNADASRYPATLAQGRFNQIFPILSGAFGGTHGTGGGGGVGTPGGPTGTQPRIDANPIYNEQQIQQQVNSQRAANDTATQGRVRQNTQDLAGRGAGTQSPLLMALNQAAMGQNLQTNTANERDMRWNAAGGNAQHVLAAQQAQEAQYANRQQEAIGRTQAANVARNSILSALAGLV